MLGFHTIEATPLVKQIVQELREGQMVSKWPWFDVAIKCMIESLDFGSLNSNHCADSGPKSLSITTAVNEFQRCAIVNPLLATVIPQLAAAYPNALFIHSTRKVDKWLRDVTVVCLVSWQHYCVDGAPQI